MLVYTAETQTYTHTHINKKRKKQNKGALLCTVQHGLMMQKS